MKNASYEYQYFNIINSIYKDGYSDGINGRTGVATKRLPHQMIQVNLGEEFPILKSKKVFWKSAIEEILWIMQKQSNNIHDLRPHIWDEWADETGSIKKAYGYQVNKSVKIDNTDFDSQVHYVLDSLEKDPSNRRCLITLWNVDDLNDMALVPCCHTSTWNLDGGKLNCLLDQRSGDIPYGVPFNTTQYAALTIMFARHLGVQPGILTHVIADAHIYDRQMKGAETFIEYYKYLMFNQYPHSIISSPDILKDYDRVKINNSKPKLVINNDSSNFFDLKIEDFKLENYKSMPKIDFGDVVV